MMGQEKEEDRSHNEKTVLREVAEGSEKKTEQEVVQRGFRERDVEGRGEGRRGR